jgi:hypothetical protein
LDIGGSLSTNVRNLVFELILIQKLCLHPAIHNLPMVVPIRYSRLRALDRPRLAARTVWDIQIAIYIHEKVKRKAEGDRTIRESTRRNISVKITLKKTNETVYARKWDGAEIHIQRRN